MKKLLSLFLLLFAVNAFAQTEIGWVTALDCGTITDPLTNGTICLQVENGSGRIAGHTYRWNGSTWFDITFDPDVNITGINGAIPSDTNPMPSRLTDGTTFYKATTPSDTQPISAASLPLPAGASTAAKQPALGIAGTASADVITVQGIAGMTAVKVDGSAVTQPVSGTVAVSGSVAVTGPLTDAQLRATPVPVSGTVTTGGLTDTELRATPVPVSGTVAATQSGTWTVQPGNTANTTAWKVDGSAVTQPVSGTVTAAQATAANLNATVVQPTGTNLHAVIDSGSTTAVTGNVTVVQPTGTNLHAVLDATSTTTVTQATGTNLHVVTDSTSTTAVTQATASNLNAQVQGAGASGAAKAGNPVQIGGVFNTAQPTVTTGQAVEVQSTARGAQIVATGADTFNVTVNAALPAGSAVIGHVIADTGSTTAVTGNVTVVQPTGTNLHAVLDATSTTAVTQATATNLNAAVVGTGTAGSPAGNILTVQGVASMTKLLVTPDSVALPANQSVNVAQVAGTNTVTGGVAGIIAVGGNVANAVAATANPVPVGGVFTTAPTTLTTGQTATAQFTAAQNLKHDVTTIAGTAPTTAGKIDVKGADGDVFVRQATAANLNATVVQATGTNLHVVTDSGSTTAVTGTVTTQDSQAAADNSTNSSLKTPVLNARANANPPAWTEGNQVPLSVDLLGSARVASNPRNQYNIELGTQSNPIVVAMARAIPSTAPVQTAPLTIASNRLVGAFGQPIGTTADRLKVEPTPAADPCVNARKRDAPISQTATSIVIPNMQGMSIFVCAIRLVAAAAEIVSEWEGNGAACGTGTIAHSGSTTAANGESLAANGGFAMGDGNSMLSSTLPGNDYCIAQSTSSRVSGKISYVYAQ